ncbi:hypothetical protein [Amycolatopsis saalfeldensis]|uniref:Homeodomain-like domain-containing protein n=1 Tax=Amycolatopsis saalfeldensis TaxID=394193 RepID=A0A1H8YER2_9PSEU|nr:hypothetical protein [Amycolatopsis saalfeldensis]SEP50572.1 hypothetical protein SAMN04489732_114203 [Amycolatopsis saalfeldensis]
MSEDPEEVLRLRVVRAEVEDVKEKLRAARAQQEELEKKVTDLLAKQRKARDNRREAILAADAAGIPRLRISKEVGMPRGNMYKLLAGDSSDDS